jgi:hypothetical protein
MPMKDQEASLAWRAPEERTIILATILDGKEKLPKQA